MSKEMNYGDIMPHVVSATEEELYGGIQRKILFKNCYGASVVCHPYSYGGDKDLWELAVLGQDGHLTCDTPVTDDVIGNLADDEVVVILKLIASLPSEVS